METPDKLASPILIIEGDGDKEALPYLLRQSALRWQEHINVQPNPIMKQNIIKLRRQGKFERFLSYAIQREGNVILVILDSDDECPKDVAGEFVRRARDIRTDKRIGITFFEREFESMFLFCLNQIRDRYPEYGWDLSNWRSDGNYDRVRGAKETISRHMKKGKAYKETRDQVKFVNCINFDILRDRMKSFLHFESLVDWLLYKTKNNVKVFPEIF